MVVRVSVIWVQPESLNLLIHGLWSLLELPEDPAQSGVCRRTFWSHLHQLLVERQRRYVHPVRLKNLGLKQQHVELLIGALCRQRRKSRCASEKD